MKTKVTEDFSNELLLDIDFSEFDKVVGFQATKDEPKVQDETITDIEIPDETEIKVLDEPEPDPVQYIANPNEEFEVGSGEDEEKDEEEDEEKEGEDIVIEESPYKSLAEVYNIRKNFKTNKLVESILCDSVVDTIYDSLQSILRSHGITKANAIVVIGLMLDRMLKADDSEVVRPDFIKEVLGDLLDDVEIQKMVRDAVQKALLAEPRAAQIERDPSEVNVIVSGNEEPITIQEEE